MQRFESRRPNRPVSNAYGHVRASSVVRVQLAGASDKAQNRLSLKDGGTTTLLEMRMFDFSRPGRRVFSEFDSEMQWFEFSRPKFRF